MDLSILLVSVFTFIDDWLQPQPWRLRQRGPRPTLADSEVLTLEVVGALLGYATDKGAFEYFQRHWGHFFPALRRVHRTTYTRQAANLWWVKEALWRHLLTQMSLDPAFSIVDSVPIPVCRLARASYCRRLRESSAYGYDGVARQKFYGLRAHLLLCWPGVIVDVDLVPANIHELTVAEPLLEGSQGWVLGDRNYWSPQLAARLREHDLVLLAPYRSKQREKTPWPTWLSQKRYRIETVIGQLTERFQVKRVWARDLWHLCTRLLRQVLSHTFGVFLCQQNGISSLRIAELLTE